MAQKSPLTQEPMYRTTTRSKLCIQKMVQHSPRNRERSSPNFLLKLKGLNKNDAHTEKTHPQPALSSRKQTCHASQLFWLFRSTKLRFLLIPSTDARLPTCLNVCGRPPCMDHRKQASRRQRPGPVHLGRGCSTRFRGEDALSSDTPRDESAVARRGQSRGRGRQQGQGAPQASPDPRKTGARMGNQERNAGKDTVSRHRSVKGWGQACDISGTDKLD